MVSSNQRRQLLGLALLTLGLFTALSLVPLEVFGAAAARVFPDGNIMGVLGSALFRGGYAAFGMGVLFLPVSLTIAGAFCFGWIDADDATRWGTFLTGLIFIIPPFAAFLAPNSGVEVATLLPERAPGWIGRTLATPLVALLGWFGAAVVLTVALIALSIATIGWNPASAAATSAMAGLRRLRAFGAARAVRQAESTADQDAEAPAAAASAEEPDAAPAAAALAVAESEATGNGRKARLGLLRRDRNGRGAKSRGRQSAAPALDDVGDPASSERPPLSLLSEPPARDASLSEGELDRLGEVLIRTLATFKVEGQIAGRTTGPVVTQFEVVPAPGVKVNRIAALDADLALALRAPSIRIVAPIPGKGAVGVEVPNPEPEVVYLRRILESSAFQRSRGHLPIALGKDLTGKPYVADLVRMPHLLIAGTTGSGKSICINTLITSLVYRHAPNTLRLLMVDPKMVELSMYGDLPHLRHPVVTDPHDAATVLKWAVMEMERRYELLSENGARSLTEFNRRVQEGQPLRRAHPMGDENDPDRWVYAEGELPYIVVVVDELADLMMTVQAEIEKPLAQLAQKARAIGIHLIVATQRPSVNVITGLIKANFPCRIAFRVSSKVDSRTILDQNGADALLGNGDMLFLPPGHSDPVRIQGAFIPTEDTERLMAWYRASAAHRPASEEDILDVVRSREASEEPEDQLQVFEERDALFRQAAEICMQFQQGSTSLLQRRLRIGYGRAARIIDQLHQAGILGPPDGSKPREVLVGLESLDHICRED
jgi:S-DNA-T family DNA segregation ATPase FtsK/SpoIIIE